MGYRTETSAKYPCPCGNGKVFYSYEEHDTYVEFNNPWAHGTIDCPDCSGTYFIGGEKGAWFYQRREDGSKFPAPDPDK